VDGEGAAGLEAHIVTDLDRSRIISFWHERASKTDATATRFHAEHLDYDLAALAPFCRAGARVLEIGCGQCALLNTLVQKFGVTAHGVELVASYLDQAIKDEKLTTEVADAVGYTPRPGFDVVILAGLINSIPAVGSAGSSIAGSPRHWRRAGCCSSSRSSAGPWMSMSMPGPRRWARITARTIPRSTARRRVSANGSTSR
jgi:hypothetical protein